MSHIPKNELNKEKIDYLKTVFLHNRSMIQLADNKASILLRIITVILPIIFGVDSYLTTIPKEQNLTILQYSSFIICMIILIISFYLSTGVLMARTKEEYNDHIFFLNIVKDNLEVYQNNIEEMDDYVIFEDYIKENYAIAEINKKKYRNFKFSFWFLNIGILILVIRYILLFSFLVF